MLKNIFPKLFLALAPIFFVLPAAAQQSIILATTTSTQDSGLLDALIPVFEKQTGCIVKTIAVGSGQAMAMGRRGEADVLLVHSPDAEELFVKEGFGVNRRIVMHNDFVVLGPGSDPAKIKEAKGGAEAFALIAKSQAAFYSRGDESGTHALEKKVWKIAQVEPKAPWYQETGLGMGQTLSVTSEKRGYTLADRGTYLALKKNLGLEILSEGDPIFMNVYHVIEASAEKFPKVNAGGARQFADFMVSEAAQKMIAEFGKEKFGSPLFFPDAAPKR